MNDLKVLHRELFIENQNRHFRVYIRQHEKETNKIITRKKIQ